MTAMTRRSRWLITLFAATSLVASGCATDDETDGSGSGGEAAASDEPIVIGGTLGLTGAFSGPSAGYKVAYDYWLEEINAAGGLLGRPVEMRILRRREQPDDRSAALPDTDQRRPGRPRSSRRTRPPSAGRSVPITERAGMVLERRVRQQGAAPNSDLHRQLLAVPGAGVPAPVLRVPRHTAGRPEARDARRRHRAEPVHPGRPRRLRGCGRRTELRGGGRNRGGLQRGVRADRHRPVGADPGCQELRCRSTRRAEPAERRRAHRPDGQPGRLPTQRVLPVRLAGDHPAELAGPRGRRRQRLRDHHGLAHAGQRRTRRAGRPLHDRTGRAGAPGVRGRRLRILQVLQQAVEGADRWTSRRSATSSPRTSSRPPSATSRTWTTARSSSVPCSSSTRRTATQLIWPEDEATGEAVLPLRPTRSFPSDPSRPEEMS